MATTADQIGVPRARVLPGDLTRPATLALSHMWVAFITFFVACLLGLYQVLVRAEIFPALTSDVGYYASVTLHGTIMAYVLTTFFIVGFGYYVTTTSLKTRLWGTPLAWFGFLLMLVGTVMAALVTLAGKATILYTFYPPNLGHWGYYVGATLLVVGSWFWVLITLVMTAQWKKANPGKPLPLAQFANTANALLWFFTTLGVASEVLFQLIPLAFGWIETVDAGLARTLFAWTLHPIVYFWLIPAYMAFYVFVPRAAGSHEPGRLISDEMGRIAFIMLLVFSLPIGFHHLYMDPQHADGWKLLHAFGTFMVAVPTLITGFSIIASLEITGRLNGGRGMFGWLGAINWREPIVLATGLAFLILTYGGFGGVVNASYALNVNVHNTQWVTAHFHAIFGGTTVIMYFGIAYYLWPSLTGRQIDRAKANLQLWLWFIGILVTTLPWHILGLLGQPRRVATMPYGEEITGPWDMHEYLMILGGIILTISAILLIWNLFRGHGGTPVASREVLYTEAVKPPLSLPNALNGFSLWLWILLFYMILSFAYPILQFLLPTSLGGLEVYPSAPWQ